MLQINKRQSSYLQLPLPSVQSIYSSMCIYLFISNTIQKVVLDGKAQLVRALLPPSALRPPQPGRVFHVQLGCRPQPESGFTRVLCFFSKFEGFPEIFDQVKIIFDIPAGPDMSERQTPQYMALTINVPTV